MYCTESQVWAMPRTSQKTPKAVPNALGTLLRVSWRRPKVDSETGPSKKSFFAPEPLREIPGFEPWTHDFGQSPWAQRPKTASRRFLLLLSGNSVNIVIKNPWGNWTHRTASDDLSSTKIFASKRFATIHFQSPTVPGHTWKDHDHADRHVSMTYDQ